MNNLFDSMLSILNVRLDYTFKFSHVQQSALACTQDIPMPEFPEIERIPSDLEELLDRFFAVSRQDLEQMRNALHVRDFETLVRLGHTARGTGSGYGFKGMGRIGHEIELAALNRDPDALEQYVDTLARYLDTVRVEFDG